MKSKEVSIAIIVAIIGLCGVLGAAVINNWDKIFSTSPPYVPPNENPSVDVPRSISTPTIESSQVLLTEIPALTVPAVQPSPTVRAFGLFDDFDNMVLDSKFNTNLWSPKPSMPCDVYQEHGHLVFKSTNTVSDSLCFMTLNDPPSISLNDLGVMSADISILEGGKGDITQEINFITSKPPVFSVDCGFSTGNDVLFLKFSTAYDGKPQIFKVYKTNSNDPAKFRLEFDVNAMMFKCFANDQLVGTAGSSDLPDLGNAFFERRLSSWRPKSSSATAIIDNVSVWKP